MGPRNLGRNHDARVPLCWHAASIRYFSPFIQSVGGVAGSVIPPDALIRMMEDLLETPMVNQTVGQVLEDILDIQISVDEQCLHLAVSTPQLPTRRESTDQVFMRHFVLHSTIGHCPL